MKDLQSHSIELSTDMVDYLRKAADTYGLPDLGKAVRCLVNYARDNPEKRDEIFNEVRCVDC